MYTQQSIINIGVKDGLEERKYEWKLINFVLFRRLLSPILSATASIMSRCLSLCAYNFELNENSSALLF